jgi:hypothetical protein
MAEKKEVTPDRVKELAARRLFDVADAISELGREALETGEVDVRAVRREMRRLGATSLVVQVGERWAPEERLRLLRNPHRVQVTVSLAEPVPDPT